MALSDTLLENGFKSHVVGIHGNQFSILSGPHAGETFMAVDEVFTPQVLDTELGQDPREMIVLHCPRPAPPLDQNARIAGRGANWIVLKREDNPVDVSVDFWAAVTSAR